MSDTPRTDAKCAETAECAFSTHAHYGWKFARTLERDLSNAKEVRQFMTDKCLEAQEIARLAQNEIINLRVELAEAREDAERYRWMKREVKRIPPGWELIGWDAAIDAARKS